MNAPNHRSPESLMAMLTDDLQPVRPLRLRDGLAGTAAAVALAVAGVMFLFGLRPGLAGGDVSVFYFLANGVLVTLGLAAATAVIAMASPRVGNRHDGPRWASAVAAVMPAAAMVLIGLHWRDWRSMLDPADGWFCAAAGLGTALVVAVPLALWLRRGAAVAPERAGTWLGVAAGALGSAAYGLSCPVDTLYHLAIWHFLPVALAALAGRLFVPGLIRW